MKENERASSEKAEPQKDSAPENEGKLAEEELEKVSGGAFGCSYYIPGGTIIIKEHS